MLGEPPADDPEIAVRRLRERLAPDAPRSLSTLLARRAALESVTETVRNAEHYPDLLAAVASVLQTEVCNETSDAASLFGMRGASRRIRRCCVTELSGFDLDSRLESDEQPDADARLLEALGAVVREGDVLPSPSDPHPPPDGSLQNTSLPRTVAVTLDHLLFASPDHRVRGHATVLEGARRTVVDRVLSTNPDDVTRENARVAAVLTTQQALESAQDSRVHALVDRLTAAQDAMVAAWGWLIAATYPEAASEGDSPRASALVDAVHAALERGDANREAPWTLARAMAPSTATDRRASYVEALSSLNIDADRDVHGRNLEMLARLGTTGALGERHAPVVFESVRAGLLTTDQRRQAAELVDALLASDVVPAAFLDELIASLARDATSDDNGVARSALDGLHRLFDVAPVDDSLKHPEIAQALSGSARRHLLTTSETVLLDGEADTVIHAARVLRDVAHAAPEDDSTVHASYDRLLETAIHDTGETRTRACTGIAQYLERSEIPQRHAERFLGAQEPAELAGSLAAIEATSRLLSSDGTTEALDLDAYSDALVDRIPDIAPEDPRAVLAALDAVASARRFDTPADGIEFLSAALDVHAHEYGEDNVNPPALEELKRIVDAVPSPDSPTALSPLIDRLMDDDPNVRRGTVKVLDFATSDEPVILRGTLDDDYPLLAGELVHPLVQPLVDQVTRGEVERALRRDTLSMLEKHAVEGWLTEAQLDTVADLAFDLLDDHPESASMLLERPVILERLAPADIDRVFRRYVTALEPPDHDTTGIVVTVRDPTEFPSRTLDVLSTLLETKAVTPAEFLDAIQIRELGAIDAPSIASYVFADSPRTGTFLSLLEWAAERTDRSLSRLARPLEEAIAATNLDERDRVEVLEFLTRLDSIAEGTGE